MRREIVRGSMPVWGSGGVGASWELRFAYVQIGGWIPIRREIVRGCIIPACAFGGVEFGVSTIRWRFE